MSVKRNVQTSEDCMPRVRDAEVCDTFEGDAAKWCDCSQSLS
jgi:hypothetical protein